MAVINSHSCLSATEVTATCGIVKQACEYLARVSVHIQTLYISLLARH